VGDHLIDVDVDVWGSGRMADDSLLTDLLILSHYLLPLDRWSEEESRGKRIREQETLYSIRSILYTRHDVQ
jgi:hypothetical protein